MSKGCVVLGKSKEKIKKLGQNFYLQTKGGTITFKGSSMRPALEEGWRVKVVPTDLEEIKAGEIIVFSKNGDTLTCHRALGKFRRKGELFLLEKGDSNHYLPGIVSAKDIIGKVAEIKNEDLEVISKQHWNHQGRPIASYYSIISFIYKVGLSIKRVLLGENKNNFTNSVCKLYWRYCFSLGKLILRKKK